ncbi:GTPase binding protein Rid1 [Metarhizium brunneum]
MAGQFVRNNPGALGELQQNHQDVAPRSPRKSRDEPRAGAQSPTKSALGKLTFRSNTDKETTRMAKSRDPSPDKKPKKTKSGTNLVGLLSRPKSLKNLYKLATEEESRTKDKENMTPVVTPVNERPPPIFAQFTSDRAMRQGSSSENTPIQATKDRPRSFQPPKPHHDLSQSSSPSKTGGRASRPVSLHPGQTPRGKGPFGHGRAKSTATTPANTSSELQIDPKDIDQQLEALLDRRNIPENQRYKMRNLADTIKLEFIRQDYAEMQAARADGPGTTGTTGSTSSSEQALVSDPNSPNEDEERPKRSRGRSFTFSRGKKDSSSPAKKSKAESTLGRHFRSRSTDSVASDARPSSSSSFKGSGFLSKIKVQQGPSDYVAYLRKVQKPELVEVGKLHKLRLLLRNETVAWIEDFIQQGGMHEIVGLLNRIMEVEWREEHEDALLHENLLCLKGLATTAKAMEYLNAVQADLFPKLLHMLFDPEKKGPSEFTTRNIITSVLLTYIESAPLVERVIRAKNVLGHLRDKDPEEGQRPLPFVLEMRQERPYRVWCKEVVSVTKEVFWIFLHNLNVVALASDKAARSTAQEGYFASNEDRDGPFGYMLRNFPQERPPVPAAPYVGGVEWDATNYLASHLDLMNAIIACTPSARERNILRAEFRISGWERCLGGSLRICKEKFYGSVHVALRTWVAAAAEDGWDVKDVRFGPPPESRSPKKMGGGQKPKIIEAPPKLEMPKLDFGANQPSKESWL